MPQELITGQVYGEQPARERTREFLLSEADRPLSELLGSVVAAHAQLAGSLQAVSPIQAAFEPGGSGEDAFSIAQVIRHVAGSAAIMAERLESIGLGQEPKRSTSPGNFGDVHVETLPELDAPLHQCLDLLRGAVREIDGRERLEKTVPHPMFGDLNCRAYLRLIGLHFEDHTRQIENIKADPNYPTT